MKSYEGSLVVFYENGKAVRIPLDSYQTKTNRKKLTNALASGIRAVGVFQSRKGGEYFLQSDDGRALLVKEEQIVEKSTRSSSGSSVFTLKKGAKLVSASIYDPMEIPLEKPGRYRKSNLPATGVTCTLAEKTQI